MISCIFSIFSPVIERERNWWNINLPTSINFFQFSTFDTIMFVKFFLFGVAIILLTVVYPEFSAKEKRIGEINRLAKDINNNREIPFDGNIILTYALLLDIRHVKISAIVNSLLTKWALKRQIEIDISEIHIDTVIQLYPASPEMDIHEQILYTMMQRAADPTGALQAKAFSKWCERNSSELNKWFDKCRVDGKQQLSQIGVYESVEFRILFFAFGKLQITEAGQEMALRTLGYKRYLESLSAVDEQLSPGSDLWQQHLIFAQLFGIAEHVASSLSNSNMYSLNSSRLDSHELMLLTYRIIGYADSIYSGYRRAFDSDSRGNGGSDGSSGGGGCDCSGGDC